ncbi:uncharacterized protein BDV14DRAFT_177129 [Aspergillus stella-maris]|uniref:uncharacterized protein n=1 Tax=Aspergillus stella-maris TaxID=1810926 RepID=UPI003CCD6CEE
MSPRFVRMILERSIYEVEVSGVEFICKLPGSDPDFFTRELAIFQKLSLFCLGQGPPLSLRIPKLERVVGPDTKFLRILLTKVRHRSRLSDIDIEGVNIAKRLE